MRADARPKRSATLCASSTSSWNPIDPPPAQTRPFPMLFGTTVKWLPCTKTVSAVLRYACCPLKTGSGRGQDYQDPLVCLAAHAQPALVTCWAHFSMPPRQRRYAMKQQLIPFHPVPSRPIPFHPIESQAPLTDSSDSPRSPPVSVSQLFPIGVQHQSPFGLATMRLWSM